MTELLVIFIVVLLFFGPKKIPELARGLGRGLQEFKKAAEDVKRELSVEDDVKSLRDSVEKEKKAGE
ncbi:MAG: twin-arginine translocase TatA/TatE family subunit [candidate division KSB1 bacterium]|nr:twin-arginine translocase TatA/TatE family subunit [candidate division KSB1 bacterium]